MQAVRIALSLTALALLPNIAAADLLPPPGARERAFADEIVRAGHPCPTVSSFKELADEAARKFAAKGLVAYAVECGDGHKYLVANPPRRHGYQPNAPEPPAPIIRVWE
jgi:hypothetical protein